MFVFVCICWVLLFDDLTPNVCNSPVCLISLCAFPVIACVRRPGVITMQALSEEDRRLWMEAMDGREPVGCHGYQFALMWHRQTGEWGRDRKGDGMRAKPRGVIGKLLAQILRLFLSTCCPRLVTFRETQHKSERDNLVFMLHNNQHISFLPTNFLSTWFIPPRCTAFLLFGWKSILTLLFRCVLVPTPLSCLHSSVQR